MTFEAMAKEVSHFELPIYQEPIRKEVLHVINELIQERCLYRKALWMACDGHNYLVNDFLEKASEEFEKH